MPWSETTPMIQREHFVDDKRRGLFTMTELCQLYGVSRRTGYKWLARYEDEGWAGLEERSRARKRQAHRTPADIEKKIVAMRRRRKWGGRKIVTVLRELEPDVPWPAPSTATDILRRKGMVKPRRRRRKIGHPGAPTTQSTAPGDVCTIDHKGKFRVGTGEYCYPLTVVDDFSRYILGCDGHLGTTTKEAKRSLTRIFREHGLPRVIRTDNGVPFASNAIQRLSLLSVWWIRLGIRPELIELGKPQQNGRHERMHRELKARVARPAAATMSAQRARLTRFRRIYNEERPHEGIGMVTPASIYVPSPRPFPERLPDIVYPSHFEVRLVSKNGGIRWNSEWINVSHTLIGEYLGFEEVEDGIWSVYFSDFFLGRLDERELVLYGAHAT